MQRQLTGLRSASHNYSTTAADYNPEVNGLVERWHCVLKDTLKHQDLVDRLPMLLLNLRARPSSVGGLSPHQLVFGRSPITFRLPVSIHSKNWVFTKSCSKTGRAMSTPILRAIDDEWLPRTWWLPPTSSCQTFRPTLPRSLQGYQPGAWVICHWSRCHARQIPYQQAQTLLLQGAGCPAFSSSSSRPTFIQLDLHDHSDFSSSRGRSWPTGAPPRACTCIPKKGHWFKLFWRIINLLQTKDQIS